MLPRLKAFRRSLSIKFLKVAFSSEPSIKVEAITLEQVIADNIVLDFHVPGFSQDKAIR